MTLPRRRFLKDTAAASAGALVAGGLVPASALGRSRDATQATTPLIITSHENETGQRAVEDAWSILASGGPALDAVERGANIIELDPEDMSVGMGGLPNEHGVIQLDASIMDGRTYNAGSVAALENTVHASSVARLVMERTDHVMIVGPAARDFAASFGIPEQDLMTDRTRQAFLRWRENHAANDDWGPPDHLRASEPETESGRDAQDGAAGAEGSPEFTYGTTNVLSVDANGDVAGITTTSGLSWKINGRIGDSPIIGAGLYVDNDVGAAGATGRGEDVIKSCASFYIVMRMREGRSPQEACEDAIQLIVDKYRNVNPDFIPSEKFVAINKAGEFGCASMGIRGTPRMSVRSGSGLQIYEGSASHAP